VLAWVASHRELAAQILALLQDRSDAIVRGQSLLSPAAQTKSAKALAKFFSFWFQGEMDSPAAAAALLGWVDVVRAEGVDVPLDSTMAALHDLLGATPPPNCPFDCDAEMTGFLEQLGLALGGPV
jgi:hypothetical protein